MKKIQWKVNYNNVFSFLYLQILKHILENIRLNKSNIAKSTESWQPKDRAPYISKLDTEVDLSKSEISRLVDRNKEETFKVHKCKMEEDKISLMKRLNSILTDLDAATAEKEEIEKQLEESVQKVIQLEKQLDEDQKAKYTLDSNLQEDIQYEKELNSKLSKDLKKHEHERDMLKDKIREQEAFTFQLTTDTNRIAKEFHQKSKELKLLEDEYVNKKNHLNGLERELESLRNYQKFSKEEKSRLEEEIERLTLEKK